MKVCSGLPPNARRPLGRRTCAADPGQDPDPDPRSRPLAPERRGAPRRRQAARRGCPGANALRTPEACPGGKRTGGAAGSRGEKPALSSLSIGCPRGPSSPPSTASASPSCRSRLHKRIALLRRRGRTRGFVRELLRYYGAVRLPDSVHRWCALSVSSADPGPSTWVGLGISRFPRRVFVYAHRFSDRARPGRSSR